MCCWVISGTTHMHECAMKYVANNAIGLTSLYLINAIASSAIAKPIFINSAIYAVRRSVCAAAVLRLVNNCLAKYMFGSTQTSPPNNADNATSRLNTNKIAAIQIVASHCHTSIRFICTGIVNLRTKFFIFYFYF